MSKEYAYAKVVEGARLHNELTKAGYKVETIYSNQSCTDPSQDKPWCKVVLPDDELKDPSPIVAAHVPCQKTPLEKQLDLLLVVTNEYHTLALQAYTNWGSLNPSQKDQVLKFLLSFYIATAYERGLFAV